MDLATTVMCPEFINLANQCESKSPQNNLEPGHEALTLITGQILTDQWNQLGKKTGVMDNVMCQVG